MTTYFRIYILRHAYWLMVAAMQAAYTVYVKAGDVVGYLWDAAVKASQEAAKERHHRLKDAATTAWTAARQAQRTADIADMRAQDARMAADTFDPDHYASNLLP